MSECEIYIGNQKTFSSKTFTDAIAVSSLTILETRKFYVGDRLRVYDEIDTEVVGTAKIIEVLKQI